MSKILIVEDDITIIRTLDAYLHSEGFETVSVSEEREALTAIVNENVDLLLLEHFSCRGEWFCRL